jgi:uncharacterized protein HemY
MSDQAHEVAKQVGDAASILTVIGTIVNYLPAIAALFSIVWTLIRIYETPTVQGWIHGRGKKNAES